MSTDSSGQMHGQAITSTGKEPSFHPIGDAAHPAGYTAPAFILKNGKKEDLAQLADAAGKVLQDPLRLRLLSDRVYELMQEDLRRQQERSGNYRGSI